jgi:hypothetical protein
VISKLSLAREEDNGEGGEVPREIRLSFMIPVVLRVD